MPDLNEMVLPTIWSLIRGALTDREFATRQELVDALTPVGLIDRSGGTSTSRHVGPSLRMLEELGIVTVPDEGPVAITTFSDEDAFRLEVLKRFLEIPFGQDVWEVRSGTTRLEHHAEVAVAWLCLQGVENEAAAFKAADRLLQRQLGVDRELMRDGAPFDTLSRLVEWFGIAAQSNSTGGDPSLVPMPTTLIRACLDDLIPPGVSVQMAAFLESTATTFPWLPHGWIGRAVAAGLAETALASEPEQCPQCLALALLQLEVEGQILLEFGDDAMQRVSLQLTGGETRQVARLAQT